MKIQIITGTLLVAGFSLIMAFILIDTEPAEETTETSEVAARILPMTTVEASDSLLAWKIGMMTYRNAPFSGVLMERYADGRVKSKTEYVNGKRHGIAMQWYPDGIVKEVRYYTAGAKVGVHTGWWPHGEVRFSYAFKDGVYHGDFREWYESGQPARAFYYQDGRETGAQKAWRENGKLYVNLVYKNGRRYGIAKQKPCFSIVDGRRLGVGDDQYTVFDNNTDDDSGMSDR